MSMGVKACQMLIKTYYFNTSKFFDMARLARLDGTYHKLLKRLTGTTSHIGRLWVHISGIYNFGLTLIDQEARAKMLDLLEDRYEKSSIIIATQIPVEKWHGLIGESTIADAILDRIAFSSHRIELEGESMRQKLES